jgi:hypothetical protein
VRREEESVTFILRSDVQLEAEGRINQRVERELPTRQREYSRAPVGSS